MTKTVETVLKVVAEEGKPLFDDINHKPEFKTEQCEKCKSQVMGYRWGYGEEKPYCIKPSCWEKKQQEVLQARAKRPWPIGCRRQPRKAEEFRDYKTEGMDLSECQDCEHKKIAKGYSDNLTEACFSPSCFKKKKMAATREKNKAFRDAFQIEVKKIAELSKAASDACLVINMPRQVLVYLAAQILANISNYENRKMTRYQYVKEKFGWSDEFFKNSSYQSLNNDWETFKSRLETLSEQELWEIIFEWPAVANGLKGIRSWIFGFLSDEQPVAEEAAS